MKLTPAIKKLPGIFYIYWKKSSISQLECILIFIIYWRGVIFCKADSGTKTAETENLTGAAIHMYT